MKRVGFMKWDSQSRRVEKPCAVCHQPTKGRSRNGGGVSKPACIGCAVSLTIGQALKVCGTK